VFYCVLWRGSRARVRGGTFALHYERFAGDLKFAGDCYRRGAQFSSDTPIPVSIFLLLVYPDSILYGTPILPRACGRGSVEPLGDERGDHLTEIDDDTF
jgi:hypothetical protein